MRLGYPLKQLVIGLIGASVVLALTVSLAHAGTLLGSLTDADDKQPLPYGSIVAKGGAAERTTLSGVDGRWRIDDLPAGEYTVTLSYLGYKSEERTVQVADDDVQTIDVALEVEAIRMEGVVVEGDRTGTDQRVQTGVVRLDSEDLKELPAFIESDPIRTLQLLPGVQAASDISAGLYVRGGGPDQNLVLLDGVPVYNPTHAFGLFSSFNPDAVGAITLYKGAYPARYGGRLGSVLDVRNADSAPKFRLQGAVSTIAARLRADIPIGTGNLILSGRRTYLDPILSALDSPEQPIPGYYFWDLSGKYIIPFGVDRLEIWGYRSRDVLSLDADEGTNADLRWGNLLFSANYRKQVGDNVAARFFFWRSFYRSETDLSIFNTPIHNENDLLDTSAGAELRARVGRHHLALGTLASFYEFRFTSAFNQIEDVNFSSDPFDVSVFIEDTWTFGAGTSVRGGLRTRYLSDGERILYEPRLSYSQPVGERWRFKVGGGIYHQYLQLITTEGFSAGDFYLPIDETVAPSRSVQAVVGLEFQPSPAWRLSAESYYTDLQNLVAYRNDAPADQADLSAIDVFHTGGTGWASGVELFAERRLGSLTGWIGYTFGWTRRKFDALNLGEAFPPKYDRRHDLSVVGRYRSGKWTYGIAFLYGTGQAVTAAGARYGLQNPATGEFTEFGRVLAADRNAARLLPYHRLDVSVTKEFSLFGTPAAWKVQVFNLYSRRNDWFVTFDTEDPTAKALITKQLPIIPSIGIEFAF